jgi:DNA (cytosine-5)-methyltransferase 1
VNELALFAGAGGGILGGHLLGWRTVCAVEWEPYPASVLCARQNDGLLPTFPVWDDIQTFDGRPWRGIVDVISGGFPCQDISAAGKGAGIDGERSGMWREMARVIYEVRPRFVFVENSPMLTSRGLGTVLGDLASMGFDARWGVLGAADVGAPHQRDRIWIVAYANGKHDALRRDGSDNAESMARRSGEPRGSIGDSGSGRKESARQGSNVADSGEVRLSSSQAKQGVERRFGLTVGSLAGRWWDREPGETPRTIERGLGGMADGVAARVDRLKAIGNGQVSEVARRAWEILSDL